MEERRVYSRMMYYTTLENRWYLAAMKKPVRTTGVEHSRRFLS